MGAWGTKPFEDDETLDWLSDLADQEKPLGFFKECLNLEEEEYLEYTACAGVLGAAVMIDGLLNGPTSDLPEEAVEWLKDHKKLKVAKLIPNAIAGLERLLGDESELNELWMENKELYPEWKGRINALKARLKEASLKSSES